MIGLDSNVVVRYFVQDDHDQATRAASVIDGLTVAIPGFISTVTWAEIYWVLTRTYKFNRTDVIEKLAALLNAEEIRAESPAAVAAAVFHARRGADFADTLIDIAARHAGCTQIVTFDKRAAAKLGWRLI